MKKTFSLKFIAFILTFAIIMTIFPISILVKGESSDNEIATSGNYSAEVNNTLNNSNETTLKIINNGLDEMPISDNVVFISDNAMPNGDGKTPNSPLYPSKKLPGDINEKTDASVPYGHYYKNTALYQAIEKLSATGGTVVLVGKVELNANNSYGNSGSSWDFILPSGDKNIRITSTYKGIDYSKEENGGAYLRIESPAQLSINTPTLFENLTIQTANSNRVIYANGNKLVMGNGIKCEAYLTETDTTPTDNGSYNLSIAGATRYQSFVGDTSVTIMSGEYRYVSGSIHGITSATGVTHTGDINIDIKGGTIYDGIIAGSPICKTATINGKVNINISGDNLNIDSNICLAGQGGFAGSGNIVTLNVYSFNGSINGATLKKDFSTGTTNSADKYILNIARTKVDSSLDADTILNTFVSSAKTIGVTEIYYPSAWATKVTMVEEPTTEYLVKGENNSSIGASVKVDLVNPKTSENYSQTVEYTPNNKAFTVSYDTVSNGMATASFRYGDIEYLSKGIAVIGLPEVYSDGANIKISGEMQGITVKASFSDWADSRVSIAEYGIISIPENFCNDLNAFNFEDTFGMSVVKSSASNTLNLSRDGKLSKYEAVIVDDIKVNRLSTGYHARAYVKVDIEGYNSIYVYSNVLTANPLTIAKQTVNSDVEQEVKDYLNQNVIDKYNDYLVEQQYHETSALRQKVVVYGKPRAKHGCSVEVILMILENKNSF